LASFDSAFLVEDLWLDWQNATNPSKSPRCIIAFAVEIRYSRSVVRLEKGLRRGGVPRTRTARRNRPGLIK
jgi:hypothetical protein